ncbi:MAG: GPW/gp25 family protein [Gemmatimonadaceae bacterium]|nr:GPW/gp25 family protein [Gemmatimonadaceae bacterium]
MHVDFPFRVGASGRTRLTTPDDHVRDLVEQLLFTAPGERVNRPDFGSGLLQMTFAPAGDEVVAATQLLVHGALQQWLADVIVVEAVTVEAVDSRLTVTVRYVVRRTQERRTEVFAA